MLVITKGYLIHRQDDGDFNEIISLINEHGLKFSCYCLGTRKIISKNARNLDYGNFCEFEFFYSQTKLSKLKKVTTLTYLNTENKKNYSLYILNDYLYQLDINNKKYFYLYQKVLTYLISDINDYLIMIYLSIKILNFNGLIIDFTTCKNCHQKYNLHYLNLNANALLCDYCFNREPYFLKISSQILNLLNNIELNDLDLLIIQNEQYDINLLKNICLQLFKFIYDELGLYNNFMKEI